jgi:hypothetical protein
VTDSCEHGNETSVSVNNREFLNWLNFSGRALIHGVSSFLIFHKTHNLIISTAMEGS